MVYTILVISEWSTMLVSDTSHFDDVGWNPTPVMLHCYKLIVLAAKEQVDNNKHHTFNCIDDIFRMAEWCKVLVRVSVIWMTWVGILLLSTYTAMWADHFEELGTPDLHTDCDNNFTACVSAFVSNFYKTCLDDPVGVLCEPLSYEEVAKVCSNLKSGISGVTLDYERIILLGLPFGTFYMNYRANFSKFHCS